jgi:hypothetical protein
VGVNVDVRFVHVCTCIQTRMYVCVRDKSWRENSQRVTVSVYVDVRFVHVCIYSCEIRVGGKIPNGYRESLVYVCNYLCMYVHVYRQVYMYAYMCVRINTPSVTMSVNVDVLFVHVCNYLCMHNMKVGNIHAYIHARIHTYIHTYRKKDSLSSAVKIEEVSPKNVSFGGKADSSRQNLPGKDENTNDQFSTESDQSRDSEHTPRYVHACIHTYIYTMPSGQLGPRPT